MAMNISGLGNTYNGINTNSKQYKALKEKGWLSGIMQNEAMMSPEERMIYETFGGRDTIIKNLIGLLDKIRSTGMGGISADDPQAVQKLEKRSEERRGRERV